MRRTLAGLSLAVAVMAALPAPAAAQRQFSLDRNVRLNGATKNNSHLVLTIPPDEAQVIPLTFRMDVPPDQIDRAELELTAFEAEGAPSLRHVLRVRGSREERREAESLEITLASDVLRIDLELKGIRPRTTYNATLYVLHRGRKHEWDVTLKATDLGVIVADKLPPLQLVLFEPSAWNEGRQFQIVLRDPSGRGPYPRVRARIVDPGQGKSATVTSNMTLDAFSFWAGCWQPGGCRPVDIQSPGPGDGLALARSGELKIWARAEALSPGEYNPVLRFTGDHASERADDSKLALNLQIRHHWWVAVVVILLGSAAGMFGNKYVAGYWTARALRRETEEAEQAAAALARPDPRGSPWWCRSGSNSYGLARARVILDQAGYLSRSVFSVLAVEQEIRERVDDAKRRLDSLSALQETRSRLQLASIDRAAAQSRIKASIRRALAILDGPTLRAPQKAALDALLADIEAWLLIERQEALYRDAVLDRIRQLLVSVTPVDVPSATVRERIVELLGEIEKATRLTNPSAADLLPYDHFAARLALLWRDRLRDYAESLTLKEKSGAALGELHGMADCEVWDQLRAAAEKGEIQIAVPNEGVKTFDLVEARLAISAGLPETDVIDHPCLVHWRVTQPGRQPAETSTYGLSFVQYFAAPGKTMFEARLEWNDEQIPIQSAGAIEVVQNEEYRPWAAFQSVELAVTVLAALFAIATGLGYGYNSTFGSSGQYIGLFLWAAGASAGGNMFRQRGGGRTVGGQEAQFPAR